MYVVYDSTGNRSQQELLNGYIQKEIAGINHYFFRDNNNHILKRALNFNNNAGRKIVPNTDANAPKFFTLATKSYKLVAKLATRMLHHTLLRDLVNIEDL